MAKVVSGVHTRSSHGWISWRRGIYEDELTAAGKLEIKERGAITPGGRLSMLVPIGGNGAGVVVEILGCAIVAYVNFSLIDKNHTVVTRHARPVSTGAAYALSIHAAGSGRCL